jgi:predicted nucleic acid-binding protein
MIAPVFVDTNVLLYARDASEPAKQPLAAAWMADLWRERTGRTSIQVLCEYYLNVTRKLHPGLSPEAAWDDVRALMSWRPQALDISVLERGHEIERRYRLQRWDSLVVAAAQGQGCALLLSEAMQDGMTVGGVTIRIPFTLTASVAGATFTVAPGAVHRHRPRGRSKRK